MKGCVKRYEQLLNYIIIAHEVKAADQKALNKNKK